MPVRFVKILPSNSCNFFVFLPISALSLPVFIAQCDIAALMAFGHVYCLGEGVTVRSCNWTVREDVILTWLHLNRLKW